MEFQAIRDQLHRILASREFAGALRLQRFLSFVVETSLAGRSGDIKETLVAIEVYGRSPSYNPQTDATVRVEAGRLRVRLRQYYEGSGRDDDLVITMPLGTYVPSFERRRPQSETAPDTSPAKRPLRARIPTPLAAALGVLMAALLCAGWLFRTSASGPEAHADADPASLELYFRARQLLSDQPGYVLTMDGPVPDSVLESVRLLEEVTQRSPRFAKGWVGLAEANEFAWELDKARPAKRLETAKAAVKRAIEIAPKLPEVWTIAASLHFYREY